MNFPALLGWKITSLKETSTGVSISAELTTKPRQCRHCRASPKSLRLYGQRAKTVKDIPLHGKPVVISVTRRRYLCIVCNRTSMQPMPEMHDRHKATARLIQFAAQQAFQRPFRLVACETGLSGKVVRIAFSEEVKRLEHINSCEAPRILGVDVVCIGKRQRLLLTDIEARRVISLTTNATQTEFARALSNLQNRWRIAAVFMEMSHYQRHVVHQMLPQANIIIDRFLVMSLGKHAVDAVQRHLSNGLCWLPDDASELATAYALKARFMDVWRSSSSVTARRRYSEWMASVPKELSYAFSPIMRRVETWSEEIFGFYDLTTSTYPQVVNWQIKSVQRVEQCYNFQTIRAKVIYGTTLR